MTQVTFICYHKDCLKEFSEPDEQWKHITEVHNGLILCPCKGCDEILPQADISSHLILNHDGEDWQWKECDSCHVEYRQEWILCNIHTKSCQSEGIEFIESLVPQIEYKVEALKEPEPEKSRPQFPCTYKGCTRVFIAKSSLSYHVATVHKNIRKRDCRQCGRKILVENMDMHLMSCNGTWGRQKLPCQVPGCRTILGNKSSLAQHIRIVHEKPQKTCPNCGTQVLFRNLKLHMERCTSNWERKFACTAPECQAKFFSKHELIKHVENVHEKLTKVCHICGKEMLCASFYQHQQRCVDNGEKNYACTIEGCKARFSTNADLIRHNKGVHEDVKKTCPNCGKQFRVLYKHKKLCFPEEAKFECAVMTCPETFKTKDDMVVHLNAVHQDHKRCRKKL